MSEIASGARSDVSETAYGTYFAHALSMTHQATSEHAQKLITNRQKWGVFDTLAQSKPAISLACSRTRPGLFSPAVLDIIESIGNKTPFSVSYLNKR